MKGRSVGQSAERRRQNEAERSKALFRFFSLFTYEEAKAERKNGKAYLVRAKASTEKHVGDYV